MTNNQACFVYQRTNSAEPVQADTKEKAAHFRFSANRTRSSSKVRYIETSESTNHCIVCELNR